ncbi:c-type cytochrome biogenesis protein CcsB [Flexivirga oryzae]|uniref:Cytochrome c-type biogenesis protein CcsB n=1 Tax=Flexivirga oryzae TaxID=1794944 RepID=A0A839NBT7_9MICO|nr:c-type cytochrome biogenesis protein CcsB [Flexivirga oryzae]MBB2892052.1 cytochrome c-type biogenesis protein CcsB [Flexivirga oryzae]
MIHPALAPYANLAVYTAMGLFTVTLVCFALYLAARTRPLSAAPTAAADTRTPVAAGRHPATDRLAVATGDSPPVTGGDDAPSDSRRARQIAAVALNLTYLGAACLLAAVVLRGITVMRPPNGNMYEFTIAASAAAATVYAALARSRHWEWLGAFVTGLILAALMAAVLLFYTGAAQLLPALQSYWLGIHVTIAICAVGFFTIAFPLSLLQLAQRRRNTRPTMAGHRLLAVVPDAETLERAAYGMNIVGFILWTFTLITGAIWAQEAWGAYWQWDPKEVWTFIVWIVFAAHLHGRATAGWQSKRATYIALAGYVAVVANFTLVNLSSTFAGMHNYSGM